MFKKISKVVSNFIYICYVCSWTFKDNFYTDPFHLWLKYVTFFSFPKFTFVSHFQRCSASYILRRHFKITFSILHLNFYITCLNFVIVLIKENTENPPKYKSNVMFEKRNFFLSTFFKDECLNIFILIYVANRKKLYFIFWIYLKLKLIIKKSYYKNKLN